MNIHTKHFSDSLTCSQVPREMKGFAFCYLMDGMTNDEIRHANLIALIEKFGGPKELAARLGHAGPSTISQLKTRAPDSKTGKPKGVGNALARKIEKMLDLGDGWMDVAHDLKSDTGTSVEAMSPEDLATKLSAYDAQKMLDILQMAMKLKDGAGG